MRPTFVAALLLSPVLLTASAVATPNPAEATSSAQPVRVSSGVITPAVLSSTDIHIASDANGKISPANTRVVVSMWVDATGHAQNVHVVRTLNHELDARVVEAARQFRFRPATLDNQPVASIVNLVVDVQR
jgi:TonB family protein